MKFSRAQINLFMGESMEKAIVRNGIDNIAKYSELFAGKRVGLITGPTGVNKQLKSTIDIFAEMFNLTTLYAPEHGIRGERQAGATVETYQDERTGLTVYSLYGMNKKPSPEMLANVDILAIDIQDVGIRYYTYLYTMAYLMKSCAENDKALVILDRVNPVNGVRVEGNVLDTAFRSFVGLYPIAVRYGLTIGELACLMNEEFQIGCSLEIVRLEGWQRSYYYDETDLPWVHPSPNIPTLETALLYSGTCLFEGTNISEGRGTVKPFEMIGTPWLNPHLLVERMNQKALAGVLFRPVYFEPTFSKHQGELCKGVQIHITDRNKLSAVEVGIHLLYEIMDMEPSLFQWLPPAQEGDRHFIDYLCGTDEVRLRRDSASGLVAQWREQSLKFEGIKQKYHLY